MECLINIKEKKYMLTENFANKIKEKFKTLFPVLLIMSFSTIMFLKYCLKQMLKFKMLCQKTNIFDDAINILFASKTNYLIIVI